MKYASKDGILFCRGGYKLEKKSVSLPRATWVTIETNLPSDFYCYVDRTDGAQSNIFSISVENKTIVSVGNPSNVQYDSTNNELKAYQNSSNNADTYNEFIFTK